MLYYVPDAVRTFIVSFLKRLLYQLSYQSRSNSMKSYVIRKYICSVQSRNGYHSGIVPVQSRNSHFAGRSKNSYLARFNSGIVPAQSRNRDKVRIYYFPAQSRNRGQSKNIGVIIFNIIIIIIIIILFCEHFD